MRALLIVVGSLLTSVFSFAQTPYLDHSFNGTGIRMIDFGAQISQCQALAIQKDGKIVLGGTMRDSFDLYKDRFVLTRLLADGSTDSSFGIQGIVRSANNFKHERISSMVIDTQGRIVVGGSFDVGVDSNGMIARYLPNGRLDSSFANGGIFKTGLASIMEPSELKLQPDGRIIACGRGQVAGFSGPTLLRLLQDGQADSSFGGSGWVVTYWFDNASGSGMALQPDGKIIVTGNTAGLVVVCYLSDGQLDPGFGPFGGYIEFTIAGKIPQGTNVVIQPDGKIVATGYLGNGFSSRFFMARCLPDGQADSSFGVNGVAYEPETGRASFTSTLLPDGRIILAGAEYYAASLSRYLPNGSRDSSLDTDGHISLYIGAGFTEIYQIALQPDRRIVAAGINETGGSGYVQFCVMRFAAAPPLGLKNQKPNTTVLDIFPNPAADRFIARHSSAQPGPLTLTLTDALGRIVQSWQMNNSAFHGLNQQELSISPTISNGIYYLKLSGREGSVPLSIYR